MKYCIASDLHGGADATRALLARFDESGAQRLLLLGDLLYHGPRNDLPAGYAPKEVIALLNARREVLLCVRGNCDTEVDQMVLTFPILSEIALVDTGRRTLVLTHGHRNTAGLPPLCPGDLLLCGHTHVPDFRPIGEKNRDNFIINPGSPALPKENSPRSYLLYDSADGSLSYRTLTGEEYRRENV